MNEIWIHALSSVLECFSILASEDCLSVFSSSESACSLSDSVYAMSALETDLLRTFVVFCFGLAFCNLCYLALTCELLLVN